MTIRVAAYYRVSTSHQAGSGLGLEAQEAAVQAFAKLGGFKVVSSHTDAGISGSAGLDKRPALSDALNAVLSGAADFIIVAKLDRLSRDPLCLMTIERMLAKKGSRVLSASGEGTQSDDPSAILMRRILAAVAENERALISARTKAALQAKKARGERLGKPRFGFCVVDGRLAKHPEDFQKLHTAVEMSEHGERQVAIADFLGCSQPNVSKIVKPYKVGRRGKLALLAAYVAEVEEGEPG
jgi:DNA invertase Pin-like site-specific DNA recombinase